MSDLSANSDDIDGAIVQAALSSREMYDALMQTEHGRFALEYVKQTYGQLQWQRDEGGHWYEDGTV